MKEHIHDKSKYIASITIPNVILSGLLLAYNIYLVVLGRVNSMTLVMIVLCGYVLFNTLVSKSYPEVVRLSDHAIEFESFGKIDRYEIDDIHSIYIKGLANKGLYIRINGGKLVRGRYFLKSKKFSYGDELFTHLCQLEKKKNPNSVFIKTNSY